MLNQSFSTDNLKKTYKQSTYGNKSKNDLKKFSQDIEEISEDIENRQLDELSIKTISINNKNAFIPGDIPTKIILTRTNENIRRIFKTKQADRHSIIKQIIKLLEEQTPFTITKLDIKDFYESINRKKILQEINDNEIISPTTKYIIDKLFKSPAIRATTGIPRGLSLSATLSEFHMRKFDREISTYDGVYFYSRYVDDIIIFSFKKNSLAIHKAAEAFLKSLGMNLNLEKCEVKKIVSCRCEDMCKCPTVCACIEKCRCSYDEKKIETFDYLGYEFNTSDISKSRKTVIKLAKKKKEKIKTRIIKSVLNYSQTGNLKLLKNRLSFLSGNYLILKHTSKGKPLKGGIYYNYPLLTPSSELDKTAPPEDMKELTNFLRSCINSKKGAFGAKLRERLPKNQAIQLSKLSFESGYMKRITHKFTAHDIRQIKRCW